MEHERSRLVVKLVEHPVLEPTHTFVLQFDEPLDLELVESGIADWAKRPGGDPSLWEIEQRSISFNWGASSSSLDYVVQVFNDGTAEFFWVAFGIWLDRHFSGRRTPELPDEESGANQARLSILTTHSEENAQELEQTSAAYDAKEGSRTFAFRSPTHDYEVAVLATKGGNSVTRFSRTKRDD
jgi:hypothetical protein